MLPNIFDIKNFSYEVSHKNKYVCTFNALNKRVGMLIIMIFFNVDT